MCSLHGVLTAVGAVNALHGAEGVRKGCAVPKGCDTRHIIAAIVEGKKMADISYCDGQAEKHVAFEHIRVRVELSANEKRVITVAKKKAEKEGATAAAAGEQLTKAYEEFMEDEIAPASQEY